MQCEWFAGALPNLRALPPLGLRNFFLLIMGDLLCRPTYFQYTGAILEWNINGCLQAVMMRLVRIGLYHGRNV